VAKPLSPKVVAARAERQAQAVKKAFGTTPAPEKQVLFGDLHVHTTFSADAFVRSLPMLSGEGTHPPADACDFARFCSGLDFWSINDHAEALTPAHWRDTKETIRRCNAIAGDPQNPDVVAFLGYEWTQVGDTAAEHYGHKNVIFRDTEEGQVPLRPISALNSQLVAALRQPAPLWDRLRFPLFDWANRQRYFDFGLYQEELRDTPICESGVDTRQLPENCSESALTPNELFEKLAQGGYESIVIPHGSTWGFYTPAGTSLDKQLAGAAHDPQRQILFEIYSGHGNSEEYRNWSAVQTDSNGDAVCPEPSRRYLPCCWQAGEIIRSRCGDIPKDQCEKRVRQARQLYLEGGLAGHHTVPGATVEDWKDCGQCRDCFNPSFNYRPGNSAQYGLAISNFDDPKNPRRFRFGFIASSDNHTARPGTGYKEYGRRYMTEATGARDEEWHERILGSSRPVAPEAKRYEIPANAQPLQIAEIERQASFFMTGGLVAVHSAGRDRAAIWQALKRREVYGTSGPRILLWFDLLNGPDGAVPMGSEVKLAAGAVPKFRVRAVGAFKQKPGCPRSSSSNLSPERPEWLCRGECYHPSDERHIITRVDIIRIQPQIEPGEPVRRLVRDPWKRLACIPSVDGCVVEFDDPEAAAGGRETIYYVRAVQEPTLAVNAGNLRCKYNEEGECIELKPCYGDYRTAFEDDCLSANEERAWSSPIFVDHGGQG